MAIDVKSAADTQKKWGEVTPSRSTEYGANAAAAGSRWEQATLAAAPNFGAAVRAGNIEARQSAGVRRAGAGKYSRKIRDVGAGRFGSGVSAAVQDYGTAVAPYLQTIAGVDLPPRRPRGDPGNYQRVNTVGSALHARRLAAVSAGG